MSKKMQTELIQLIDQQRKLNQDRPYLSEYENGVREGTNDTIDAFVEILSKYFPIVVNEIESLSKEPKTIWGRIVFNESEKVNVQNVKFFFEQLSKFDTKDNINERKHDIEQWNEFKNADSFGYQALFSEKEAVHLVLYCKAPFVLLESAINEEGLRNEIDEEWVEAYISEEEAIYKEVPSATQIITSWERNKEYFFQNKGKPCGVVNVNNR